LYGTVMHDKFVNMPTVLVTLKGVLNLNFRLFLFEKQKLKFLKRIWQLQNCSKVIHFCAAIVD